MFEGDIELMVNLYGVQVSNFKILWVQIQTKYQNNRQTDT